MSYQGQPNAFRASIERGPGASPVVTVKKPRAGRGTRELQAVLMPRSEERLTDHRGDDRHRLTNEQVVVRVGRKQHKVELVNLSHGGAMIEGPLRAKLWDRLELVLGPGGSVECVVRWLRGNRFGLEFAQETRIDCDPATMNAMLCEVIRNSFPEHEAHLDQASEPSVEQAPALKPRTAVRHPLIWSGTLHYDYAWEPVRICNISATGAMIESSVQYPDGAQAHLDLGSAGRMAATIRWSRGAQTGLAFPEPFDLKRLARARPEVASPGWVMPDYLTPAQEPSAPEQDPLARASLDELSRWLGG